MKLTLHESVDNAKRIKGVLRGMDGDAVVVETETGTRTIALANIDKARLVPRIEWRSTQMKKRASGSEEKVTGRGHGSD